MPKGGNGGGGGGGGGSTGDTILIKGGRGDDTLPVPDGRTILNTAFDGGRGNDTLDLSSLQSDGVYVRLNNGASSRSRVSEDNFIGTRWGPYPTLADAIDGSIRNVENLIGTSGNDWLMIDDWQTNRIEGGAGNDALTVNGGGGDTLIGGAGEDWLLAYWSGNLLVGGTWNEGEAPTGDGETDVFSLFNGTILDFEVGVDRILIEITADGNMDALATATWTDGEWVDSDGVTRSGARLLVAGHVINLAGIDADDANANITIGFVTGNDGLLHGGDGDDIFYASQYAVDTIVTGPGVGHDTIVHFDASQDVLHFTAEAPAPEDWEDVIVNGATGIRWTDAAGTSSLTILGLTTADAGSLTITTEASSSAETSGYMSGDYLIA